MGTSRTLIDARRPLSQPVQVERVRGESWLVATEPWRVPVPGETYDPLDPQRRRVWRDLVELDASDPEACAAVASEWGFLLRPTEVVVRGDTATGSVYERERVAEWGPALEPFKLAAALLVAWTRNHWSSVDLGVHQAEGTRGWIIKADGYAYEELLPSKPKRKQAAQLLHSKLTTDLLAEHAAVVDDAGEGPRIVATSLLGSATLCLIEDRLSGIRWRTCARRGCGKPYSILGRDRRTERRNYCSASCRATAHKARQRPRQRRK